MSALGRGLIAASLVGSLIVMAVPAGADEFPAIVKAPGPGPVVGVRCCGWLPPIFGGYPAVPAYYAGPLSGATYGYYYGDYWHRPYWRHRRHYDR